MWHHPCQEGQRINGFQEVCFLDASKSPASEGAVGIQVLMKSNPRVDSISVNKWPLMCWPGTQRAVGLESLLHWRLFWENSKAFLKESKCMEKKKKGLERKQLWRRDRNHGAASYLSTRFLEDASLVQHSPLSSSKLSLVHPRMNRSKKCLGWQVSGWCKGSR